MCNPTDVLKVRMQSNQIDFKNQGMIQAFVNIAKEEGLKGLYRVLKIHYAKYGLLELNWVYS